MYDFDLSDLVEDDSDHDTMTEQSQNQTIDISASPAIEMIDLTTPSTIDLCTPEDKTEEGTIDSSVLHLSSK